MFNPSSPVTGGAQTGLTSPTYTLTLVNAPTQQGKQYAVTALGGTQSGVTVHAASSPFTVNFVLPASLKTLGAVNPSTGQLRSIPRNSYKLIVRKGVAPLTGQPVVPLVLSLSMDVPAGADLVDPEDIRAALSLLCGVLWSNSASIGDSLVTGA